VTCSGVELGQKIDIFGRSTGDHNAIRMEQMMSYKERDKKIARTVPYRLLAMRQAMILFFNLECNYWVKLRAHASISRSDCSNVIGRTFIASYSF